MRTASFRRECASTLTVLRVVLGVLVCVTGCRSPAADRPLVQRWIDGAPSDELLISQLESLDCAVATTFDGGRAPRGVRFEDASTLPTSGGSGITLRGGATPPRLVLERPFAPGEADAVRLAIAGVRRGNVRLRWFTAGSPEPAGTLELTKAQAAGTLRDQFFFDLSGRLPADLPVSLEIAPTSAAGEVVTITDLCVGRARLDPERFSVAARVPWKATLDGEARDILLQPPTGDLAKDFLLPRSARLLAGFGRLAGGSARVRLTVKAEGGGEPPTVVFERLLEAGELAAGWVDLDVDLQSLGARERRLTLAAAPEPAGDTSFVGAWSAPRIVASRERSRRPNIVLISIDTLRADHLSLYGYERPTSPALDAWSRERHAAVFRHVVPPSGWTLPSHFSLFTGLEAFRHPANYNTVALDASAFSFLAERLLAAGYRTQAYTGGGFVHPIYGLAKGFEGFSYWASKEHRTEELEANLEQANRWLDRIAASRTAAQGGGDPFLLFLHTYEVHTPNAARQPYFGRFSRLPDNLLVDVEPDGDLLQKGFLGTGHAITRTAVGAPGLPLPEALAKLPVDLYDSAVAYVDEKLAPLLRRLSASPFGDDTIVILFSDHGESLGEGGLAGHANLAISTLQVPLVVVTPRASVGRDIPSQVRLLDLFPTILEFAGLEVPPGTDGESLRALLAGGVEPEGRPAWAYAASTNHGLSLLAADGLKLDWRNSLWKPIAGDLLWFRRDGYREAALAAAPATPEAERMVRQIQQVYAREVNGLRFELRNLSPQPVRVAITSDLVDPASVKSPWVDGVRLDWSYIGYMEAGLAAGKTLALQFERTQRRQVDLQVGIRSEACGEQSVTTAVAAGVEQLRQPLRRHLELPVCPGAPPAGAGLDLQVAWQGTLPPARETRSDEALREDLKALGYLH